MKIDAWTIEGAWRNVCSAVMEYGVTYKIDRGSCCGCERKQLPNVMITIGRPDTRPLAPMCKPGEVPVTNDEDIERYFQDYLISPVVGENELYTYGSRIASSLPIIASILTSTPYTNQAVIEVGRPEDTLLLTDPPCLRILDWKVYGGQLWLSSYWRSWDVYGALPVNLGGLQLLNEMMAEWSNLESGPLVAYSSGAHIYDYAWELVQWQ